VYTAGHFSSVSLQMSPSGKLRPDDAVAQAKKLLPVEIRDRAIAAMEKCRSVAQGTRYCSHQQTQILDYDLVSLIRLHAHGDQSRGTKRIENLHCEMNNKIRDWGQSK